MFILQIYIMIPVIAKSIWVLYLFLPNNYSEYNICGDNNSYDRNGDEVKRVTSTDPGTVEDPEQDGTDGEGSGEGSGSEGAGNGSEGSENGSTNGGSNEGSGEGGNGGEGGENWPIMNH